MTRLAERRGELIDRSRTVSFTWQGRPVEGLAGDTIASALFADGVRVFSRSFKYHRRRGLLCCAGQCPNCLVQVDGEPAVRACTTPAVDGMQVEHINAWPSLERDLLHAVGKATPAFGMQVGFYYKTFMRPRWAWKYYERFLRAAAGLGKIDPDHRRDRRYEKVHRHVDVLVIGGGEGGLEAAVASAREGKDTVLVDEGLALGGRLAFTGIRRGDARGRARRGGPRGRRRDPAARLGRWRLRGQSRAGLPGRHDVPLPRRRARAGDRGDRAAARLRRQRPAGRHARLGRAPAGEPVPDRARRRGRGAHGRRPRHRGRVRPGRGGGGRCGGRRLARGRRRRAARRVRHRAPARVRPGRGARLEPCHRRRGRPRRGAAHAAGRPRGDERRHRRAVRGARAGRGLGALRRRAGGCTCPTRCPRACAWSASPRARHPRSRSPPTPPRASSSSATARTSPPRTCTSRSRRASARSSSPSATRP